jgi:hypothetical protein
VALFIALASKRIHAQDASDAIGFAPGTTCAEVQERAQREGGGASDLRPPEPPPGVQARTVRRQSHRSPAAIFVAQRSGCPNPNTVCQGRGATGSHVPHARTLRSASPMSSLRTRESTVRTWTNQRACGRPPCRDVIDSTVFAAGPRHSIRCPVIHLPSVLESDDAPTVLTKWFSHVRELGYPATVDFLASEEKQRIYAAAIELARRANGTPSQALLRGLAGDGVPTDEVLAVLARSTPDVWLRQLLRAQFPGPDGLLRYGHMEILGTIPEGDITHVIARMQVESSEGSIAAVQSFAFKRSGQRLEMLLPTELQTVELGFRLMTRTLTSTR